MNCNSSTGLRPPTAIPNPTPTMPDSATGESITRSGPCRSLSPSVTLKTPPVRPTSSPISTTSESLARARSRASLIAWAMLRTVTDLPPRPFAPPDEVEDFRT
jgi:hypothetical protein